MKEGPKKALDSYNKSLKLDPKNFANLYNRGCILYNLKRFDEAKKDFENALKIEPYNLVCLDMVLRIKNEVNVPIIKKKRFSKN
jgi:tetratricopeptide (TPR) repeat protein